MRKNTAVKRGIVSALITFILGFGIMYLLWKIIGNSKNLHGLFYYRAATIGDGICLPILVGSSVAFNQYNRSLRVHGKKSSVMIALAAMLIAVVVQASWLISDSTVENWTIPEKHQFNLAGWYHAMFFVGMFGVIAYQFVGMWHVLKRKQTKYSWFEKILYGLFIASGTLFILMLSIDDYSQYIPAVILLSIVSIGILLLLSLYIRSACKWWDKELLCSAFTGIVSAYSVSLFTYSHGQGDIAIAISCGLYVCFLWRVNKGSVAWIVCKDIWSVFVYSCALYAVSGLSNVIEIIFALAFLTIVTILIDWTENKESRFRFFSFAIIEVYMAINVICEKKIILDFATVFFPIMVYIFFQKEIKDYFSIVVEAEEEKNQGKLDKNDFKRKKGKAYLQITLGIFASILFATRWLFDLIRVKGNKIELGSVDIPEKSIMVMFVLAVVLVIFGSAKIRNYVASKITAIFISSIMFAVLIYTVIINIGIMPDIAWVPVKWIMLACSVCACIGTAILSAHGYYVNIISLRGISEKPLVKVMAIAQFLGSCLLNFAVTILVLCRQTWSDFILVVAVLEMAFVLIPFLSAGVMQYEYRDGKVVPNTPLGGIAQDGLVTSLIVIFASCLPCIYISIIHKIDFTILAGAGGIIAAACIPVGYCIQNNVEHMERQKKVLLEHPNEREVWNALHKCLVRQSKLTVFAMLPYVCIAIIEKIAEMMLRSKTIKEIKREIINTYIDKDVYGITIFPDKIVDASAIENKIRSLNDVKEVMVVTGKDKKHSGFESIYLFVVPEDKEGLQNQSKKLKKVIWKNLLPEEQPEGIFMLEKLAKISTLKKQYHIES